MTNNMIYTSRLLSGDIWSLTGHLRSGHLNPIIPRDFNNKNIVLSPVVLSSLDLVFSWHILSIGKYLPSIVNILLIILRKFCRHFLF